MQFGKRRRIVAEINVTPLTDILVLLIIFMVATSAAVQSAEQVHLPKAKADEDPAAAVTVSLDSSRQISVAGRPVGSGDAVVAALRDALDASDSKRWSSPATSRRRSTTPCDCSASPSRWSGFALATAGQ